MNETMNNQELVAAGHECARHMSSDTPITDIAKMVTRLASQLDVTTAALHQANERFESQSLELKASVAAEIEWEKAMMQSIGADGIADVVSAIQKLKTGGASLAAENAALKSAKEIIRHLNVNREEANFCGIDDCYIDDAVTAMITPATDRFIAEQQAIGVEKVGEYLRGYAQGIHEEARLVLQDAKELCLGFAVKLRDEVNP